MKKSVVEDHIMILLFLLLPVFGFSQNHIAFRYLSWGQHYSSVIQEVSNDYQPRGYSVVPGKITNKSRNLSVFPDPEYNVSAYPKYALLFIDDKLSAITETVDPRMVRNILGVYPLGDADKFYKSGDMEYYVWKYVDTSLTIEYNPMKSFLRLSWVKNLTTISK